MVRDTRLSIDTHVAPRESLQIHNIPSPNIFVDYRQKSIEDLYRDLQNDLLQLRLTPAKDLSHRLEACISDSPAKQFYVFTTYAAAFAPFTTDPLSPTGHAAAHLLDSLPKTLEALTKPPLWPPRQEKLLLLRTILLEFVRSGVGRYFDRVESIVRKVEREMAAEGATGLKRSKSDAGSKRHSVATSQPGKEKKGLRIWPFSRRKKEEKREKKGWDVSGIEREAQRFSENELVQFVKLFRFVVDLQAPKVEAALIRYLEPDEGELQEAVSRSPNVETFQGRM
ncbi:hypothetical protein BJ508DRAFT_413174 [Ascobolus immersus RN42]|uniref:Uncharacterized protein n=1 Tax=Ascobolus immersus RN42 TaxID=1160509 RepID=A0A3N4IDI6_ASCIM|nr:hypothetical protein BJ508DRAFT_413174 [Ascobolus immersus RN42]